MRKMYYSVSDTAILGKKKSECSSQESNLRPFDYQFECSSLSYKKLVGAKAIKLGSWENRPLYYKDLNVNVWHMRNEINVRGDWMNENDALFRGRHNE